MRGVLFVGPSLPDASCPAGFVRRPPASAGDLLALIRDPPEVAVLIDGCFGDRLAPWHKEILLLIARGVRVIGAASMGALRAAELESAGMIGVGSIYRAYRAGRLTADDEVAVSHAPAELGFRALTEALVNVRATLRASIRADILALSEARRIFSAARAMNFRDRDWPAILAGAAGGGSDGAALARFEAWLPGGRVDLKGRDARRALLLAAGAGLPVPAAGMPPKTCFLLYLAATTGMAEAIN